MSLKLVKLGFKFGNLLALTPAKIEQNGLAFPSKIYALLWIILFSAGVSISAFFRKAIYEKLTPVILTLRVAIDTLLFVLNISTIIITATKRHQWNRFINILKFLKNSNEKGDLFWFLPFLLTNVVFVVIFTYYTTIFAQRMGVDFFKYYAVEYFQFYAQFIVYYLIYVLCMILDRVQNLSKNIKLLKIQPNRLNNFALKRIKIIFFELEECIDIFNNIFGWLILLLIGFCFLQQLSYLHNFIVGLQNPLPILIFRIMYITWHMVGTFISVFLCDLIQQRVKNMQMEAQQIAANCAEGKEYEDIKILEDPINHSFPNFTAARFFDLNRKTILGVINALLTFLIVAIQFENIQI
ncbi:uncharacterized protein LOC123011492 [Tribolium madens]|uniref:uncharacterized protein LOC123011492 n=1 Tax=Tribolium madens TaxID=41895 RepID=UPI001CF727B9|nr:uncharacterized protein LOC123011492 [Tribolium madens]